MNKKFRYYALVWAILLVIFNVICFVTPNEVAGVKKFGASFWVGYIFITLAFIGQLVCANIALKEENRQKLFYNLPLISVSWTGLIVTVAAGGLCMVIPALPYWVGVVICALVLGLTAISVVKAKAAAELVGKTDAKAKAQTLFIKSLTADAQSLLTRAKTEEQKAACKKVYEAARYSDPMSNEALAGAESQITLKFNEFSAAVNSGAGNAEALAEELAVLISDRNEKCKLLK